MKLYRVAAVVVLPLALSGLSFAQETSRQDLNRHELKQDEKADKAQVKADKDERKASKTHKAKKAAKQQEKADKAAEKAGVPPQ